MRSFDASSHDWMKEQTLYSYRLCPELWTASVAATALCVFSQWTCGAQLLTTTVPLARPSSSVCSSAGIHCSPSLSKLLPDHKQCVAGAERLTGSFVFFVLSVNHFVV